jgi:hypothetical protein
MGKGTSVMRMLTATVYQMKTIIVHSGRINIRSSRALKTILEEEGGGGLMDMYIVQYTVQRCNFTTAGLGIWK